MKLNLEIEVDFIDEEYNLVDTVKQEIIASVANTVRHGLKENIRRQVSKRVSVNIDRWIMEQLHLFCDRQIKITDKWGDTTEHHESVSEMFKAKFDEFFNASIDKNGNTLKSCSYGGNRVTRIDQMLNQKAEEYLSKITKDMDSRISRAISDEQKKKIEEKIKKHVSETVSKLVAA